MQKMNKTTASQIISGVLKFLAVAIVIVGVIVVIIPSLLSIVKSKDIPPIDDSKLQLQVINIPKEENAFYDLDKIRDVIDLKNIPVGKELVSGYLESDQWNQEAVTLLLADNEDVLQHYTDAAIKGKFQLPDADNPSKILSDMPVTPLNSWREASHLSGVKAIFLAKNGNNKEALDEAFKSIIIGNAIENSQGLIITNLLGIAIKDTGLDSLKKVVSIIKNPSALSEYRNKLENYRAKGNSSPFITEYLVSKQALGNIEQGVNNQLGAIGRIFVKNNFYYKKNLTLSYYYNFYNKLAIEAGKDCLDQKKVQQSIDSLTTNVFKMYFTENVFGKYSVEISEIALNNVLERKCATEKKLNDIILGH
ncbi:MAG: hypothetical protein ACM3PZ_03460 [Bacillota bacterium]